MSDRQMLSEIISRLKQQRDELALQVKLGETEAREEWKRVSAQLDELLQRYEPLKEAMGQSTDNVVSALKILADEVVEGFERVRKSL
jgi:uncharacterized coiled-coil DUF342 family protein